MGPKTIVFRKESRKMESVHSTVKWYDKEGDTFLQEFMSGWIHPEDAEYKAQKVEYLHKTFPNLRKFKLITPARKIL